MAPKQNHQYLHFCTSYEHDPTSPTISHQDALKKCRTWSRKDRVAETLGCSIASYISGYFRLKEHHRATYLPKKEF
jgi:hypothetical protein